MCNHREHRYRVTITIRGKALDVVFYAKGATEAFAKADGWVQTNYGDVGRTISVYHAGYTTPESAVEHGAIMPPPPEETPADIYGHAV